MTDPRVPGTDSRLLDLSCGETVDARDLDMGMREFDCDCGDTHAVVVDVHPLGRFVPESIADVLRDAIDTADEYPEFGIVHLMGVVLEEFPQSVASADVSTDGQVGYSLVWVTDFDSLRLHEIVVELLVELMEHAISHGDDDAISDFESQMHDFDVEAFVDEYRRVREFESEFDAPL